MQGPYTFPSNLPLSRSPAENLRRQRIAHELDRRQVSYLSSLADQRDARARYLASLPPSVRPDEDKGKNRRNLVLIIIIVIVVLLILAAIIGVAIWYFYFRTQNTGGSGTTVPPQCTSNNDCTDGFTCVNGVCKGGTGEACIAFIDCQSGLCYDGVCKGDLGSECTQNSDCASPFSCILNVCEVTPCASALDCPINSNCYSVVSPSGPFNGCVLNFETPCTKDSECTVGHTDIVGLRCVNQKCLRTGGGVCNDKTDCVSNICDLGVCKCNRTFHCLEDQTCTLGSATCTPVEPGTIYG